MKQCRRLLTVLVSLLLMIPAIPAIAEPSFTILAEELPPFHFTEQETVQGISTDTLLAIMAAIGQPIERSDIAIVPWARGYRSVQQRPGTVLFSMAKTEERTPLFRWVGPVTELSIGLLALKSCQIVISSPEDLKRYRIGTIIDGAPEQLVINAGVDPATLDRISLPESNIRKLAIGRIDLFAFNIPTALYLVQKLDMHPEDFQVVHELKRTALYFAFHRDTPEDIITRLNEALVVLKRPGENGKSAFDLIQAHYLPEHF